MANICANMTGSMWKILVKEGDVIIEGQEVAVLESMKMEIPIIAEVNGTVSSVKVEEGDFVNEGDVIITLES